MSSVFNLATATWSAPARLLPNSSAFDHRPMLTSDGLYLTFYRVIGTSTLLIGNAQELMVTAQQPGGSWSAPVPLVSDGTSLRGQPYIASVNSTSALASYYRQATTATPVSGVGTACLLVNGVWKASPLDDACTDHAVVSFEKANMFALLCTFNTTLRIRWIGSDCTERHQLDTNLHANASEFSLDALTLPNSTLAVATYELQNLRGYIILDAHGNVSPPVFDDAVPNALSQNESNAMYLLRSTVYQWSRGSTPTRPSLSRATFWQSVFAKPVTIRTNTSVTNTTEVIASNGLTLIVDEFSLLDRLAPVFTLDLPSLEDLKSQTAAGWMNIILTVNISKSRMLLAADTRAALEVSCAETDGQWHTLQNWTLDTVEDLQAMVFQWIIATSPYCSHGGVLRGAVFSGTTEFYSSPMLPSRLVVSSFDLIRGSGPMDSAAVIMQNIIRSVGFLQKTLTAKMYLLSNPVDDVSKSQLKLDPEYVGMSELSIGVDSVASWNPVEGLIAEVALPFEQVWSAAATHLRICVDELGFLHDSALGPMYDFELQDSKLKVISLTDSLLALRASVANLGWVHAHMVSVTAKLYFLSAPDVQLDGVDDPEPILISTIGI